ncbi:MAG: alpha/beta hydrolase [Acinetobacter sp.]|jgi:triacylglycerol lipase|nr:MAG: alpha/beta hydrolase [Acinetobacter sp.]
MEVLKYLSRPLLATCIACSLGVFTQYSSAKANDIANISFANLLQQERQWAGLQTKTVKVGDITWTYSEGGASNKPTILLIHGLSGTRDNWNRVAHYLTPYYHVIIPDLPFHGDTQTPQDFDASVPNLTEKLRRFSEALAIEKNLHLAGHSLGGAITTLYAAQYSSDTKSMLLMNAAGIFKTANTAYFKDPNQLKQLTVSKTGDFNRLMQLAMSNPPFIPSEILKQQENMMMANSKSIDKLIEQIIVIQKAMPPESFAMAARIIDCPVQIMWGEQDKIINKEVSHELKSLLKNAQEPIIYTGIGHMPLLELDQVVAKDYLNFLRKLPTTPTTP